MTEVLRLVVPTDEAIDTAVPASGVAHASRSALNRVLKSLRDAVGDVIGTAQAAEPSMTEPPAAGMVSRSSIDRAFERVSVKDFGAIGDGKTDETAAFTKALKYSGEQRRTIFVPAGRYRLCTVEFVAPFELQGESRRGSVLMFGDRSHGFLFRDATSLPSKDSMYYGRMADLTFEVQADNKKPDALVTNPIASVTGHRVDCALISFLNPSISPINVARWIFERLLVTGTPRFKPGAERNQAFLVTQYPLYGSSFRDIRIERNVLAFGHVESPPSLVLAKVKGLERGRLRLSCAGREFSTGAKVCLSWLGDTHSVLGIRARRDMLTVAAASPNEITLSHPALGRRQDLATSHEDIVVGLADLALPTFASDECFFEHISGGGGLVAHVFVNHEQSSFINIPSYCDNYGPQWLGWPTKLRNWNWSITGINIYTEGPYNKSFAGDYITVEASASLIRDMQAGTPHARIVIRGAENTVFATLGNRSRLLVDGEGNDVRARSVPDDSDIDVNGTTNVVEVLGAWSAFSAPRNAKRELHPKSLGADSNKPMRLRSVQ